MQWRLRVLACRDGEVTTTIVIAEVVLMHLLEEVCGASPTGKTIVDINKLRPMSRCGSRPLCLAVGQHLYAMLGAMEPVSVPTLWRL